MKSSLTFFLALTITAIVFQSVDVQSADAQERAFGNGRFLKRMFGDLVPKPAPVKPTPKAAAKKGQLQPKQPTLATRPSKNAQPTLAQPSPRSRNTSLRPVQPARSEHNRELVKQLPPSSGNSAPDTIPTRSNAKATLGFGMLVKLHNDKLYVAKIDPKGNAAAAGVRVGDQLRAGGGIDFESMADYNGIGDILKDGDQLEFEVIRSGRERDVLIGYGEVPQDQVNATIEESTPAHGSTSRRSLQRPAVNQINTRANNSFLPTQQNVEVTKRKQAFSFNGQQTSGRASSSQTIRQQQAEIQQLRSQIEQMKRFNPASSQIQLPPSAESVLN